MELIHFEGLNCYSNAVVTIANTCGIHYILAFAELWSETELCYYQQHGNYLSNRLFATFKNLGVNLKGMVCEPIAERWAFSQGQWIMAGMDAYDIPWNSSYKLYHSPHYFIVEARSSGVTLCHDPTYGVQNIEVDHAWFLQNCCELIEIEIRQPSCAYLHDEAKVVLQETERVIALAEESCLKWGAFDMILSETDYPAVRCAKYVDCLINNRLLYRKYLQCCFPAQSNIGHLFDDDYIANWKAVKNGLLKASIMKNSRSMLEAVGCQIKKINALDLSIAYKINRMVSKV